MKSTSCTKCVLVLSGLDPLKLAPSLTTGIIAFVPGSSALYCEGAVQRRGSTRIGLPRPHPENTKPSKSGSSNTPRPRALPDSDRLRRPGRKVCEVTEEWTFHNRTRVGPEALYFKKTSLLINLTISRQVLRNNSIWLFKSPHNASCDSALYSIFEQYVMPLFVFSCE